MSMNNKSRQMFKEFVAASGGEFVRSHNHRNQMTQVETGLIFGFVVNETPGRIDCRQFYENYDGLVAQDAASEISVLLTRDELDVSKSYNRVDTKGVRAYTARGVWALG